MGSQYQGSDVGVCLVLAECVKIREKEVRKRGCSMSFVGLLGELQHWL